MTTAATRLAALGALTLVTAACSQAAKGAAPVAPAATQASAEKPAPPLAVRVTPPRIAPPPAPPPALPTSFRLGGADYVSATDIAVGLGLKGAWTEPLHKLTFTDKTDPANQAELEASSRNAKINGLRVFLGDRTVLRAGHLYVRRTDVECCLAPLLRPGFGVALPVAPKIIALDPGHGGKDDGAENQNVGLKEKILTLDVAQRLKKLLEAAGYKVVMTRTGDRELAPKKEDDLPARAEIANREHADLFVSIHFNAAVKDTRGTEVFTFAPKNQHATEWWDRLDKTDLYFETTDVPVNRFDHWNVVFAGALHRALLQTLKTEDRGKKLAHWAVLKTLNCPGVLVEPAIITNDAEARRVATPAFRQQIAEALAAGIRDYVATLDSLRPKPPPAPAVSQTK